MINTIVAAVMAMSTLVVPSADVPPPGEFTLSIMTANGSGCPPGTAAVSVSPDNTTFHTTYSNFLAAVGVGTRPTDFRKNCQLVLQVNLPQGFTFAIAKVDYRGFIQLAKGATGTERAHHFFQGMLQPSYRTHTWQGPMNDEWYVTDEESPIVYRPCSQIRNLYLNTELRVSAGSSDPKTTTSFMALDSTDEAAGAHYHLTWKRCP